MKTELQTSIEADLTSRFGCDLPPAPQRIQLSRAAAWRMPENAVRVARPSHWGNPYPVKDFGLNLALALFRNTMQGIWSPALLDEKSDALTKQAYAAHRHFCANHVPNEVRRLRGKNLACWCNLGEPCHADILLELANTVD